MVCYDNSTDNVINVDPGVTVSGKEGAKVLPATVWDGSSVYAPAADADGDYPIYEAAELKWIADQINSGNYLYLEAKGRYAQVYLMNDIDLNNKPWTPMGCQNHSYTLSGVDKCAFYGEFHGTGHTVSNLNVDIVADAKGFIGKTLGKEASIKELTLKNVAIPLNDDAEIQGKWVGALVGCMGGDTNVSDCHVENVTIHAPGMYRIGGLVGVWTNTSRQNATATVENCSVKDATLTAGYAIGGFMGTIQPQKPAAGYNTIRNCSVENISITHKDQYCWGDDPNYAAYYPETGHYCYSSAPFAGDVNNVNLEKCTVGGSCTIADADGHNTYMSATWTKLPYMGEVGGNACIDGRESFGRPDAGRRLLHEVNPSGESIGKNPAWNRPCGIFISKRQPLSGKRHSCPCGRSVADCRPELQRRPSGYPGNRPLPNVTACFTSSPAPCRHRRRSELQLHAGGKAHAVIAVIGPVVELRIAEVAPLGEERHFARKEPVEPRRKVDRDGDFEIVEADNATTEVQP